MCKHLRCSYAELMSMPEDVYDLFRAFQAGEVEARAQLAQQAEAERRAAQRGRGA